MFLRAVFYCIFVSDVLMMNSLIGLSLHACTEWICNVTVPRMKERLACSVSLPPDGRQVARGSTHTTISTPGCSIIMFSNR